MTGRSYQGEDYPKLDSIKFNLRHKYYQTNTVTVIEKTTPQKRNKVVITPNISVGYGMINQKADLYIGLGIGYAF